jgi:hypothetical protein
VGASKQGVIEKKFCGSKHFNSPKTSNPSLFPTSAVRVVITSRIGLSILPTTSASFGHRLLPYNLKVERIKGEGRTL